MPFTTIELTQHGPIALLGLNRPDKLNAINAVMIDEINQALDRIEADDATHAIVVHGAGRAFCSGFDLEAGIAANRETEADWRAAIDARGAARLRARRWLRNRASLRHERV